MSRRPDQEAEVAERLAGELIAIRERKPREEAVERETLPGPERGAPHRLHEAPVVTQPAERDAADPGGVVAPRLVRLVRRPARRVLVEPAVELVLRDLADLPEERHLRDEADVRRHVLRHETRSPHAVDAHQAEVVVDPANTLHDRAEALHRVVLHQVEGILPAPGLPALAIHEDGARVAERDPRVGLHDRDGVLQHVDPAVVVRSRPAEVARARQREREVVVPRHPEVGRVPVVADPRIPARVLLADLGGRVGRRVVAHDDHEVAERLGEQAVEGVADVALPVVDGEADGDERVGDV